MRNRTPDVDRFVAALDHPLAAEVDRLRLAILASNGAITEQVKWKAPSFCYGGVDRVTFTLAPHHRLGLVFHRGAKARTAGGAAEGRADGEAFTDHAGLLRWITADRAVLVLRDRADVEANQAGPVELVNRWVEA